MGFLKFGILMLLMMRVAMGFRGVRSGKFDSLAARGLEHEYQFQRSKKGIEGITLRIPVVDKLRFVLRRETAFDRFAVRMGIANEWQTGDSGFDERVFILSEDWVLNQALSADRELREACGKLLANPGARLECRNGKLYYEQSIDREFKDTDDSAVASRFSAQLVQLTKLRDRLKRIVAGDWQPERDPALTRKAWLVGLSLGIALVGLVAVFFDMGEDRHQVVRETIPELATWITAGVVGLLLMLTFLWLRATPHTHSVLLDILLAAAPGCWMAANAGSTLYNEKFDRSVPQQLPVQVDYTDTKKRKRGMSYYLVVNQWPDVRGQRRVRIEESDYQWISRTNCITVTWHRGRLGDGWVSGYEKGCNENLAVEK